MTFGVLTICRDHGRYLPEAVASVHGQTDFNWRMVIVDDGSTDDSYDVAFKLAGDTGRMAVARHMENRGMGEASITAMMMLRRVYPEVTHVAVLDADDVLLAPAKE